MMRRPIVTLCGSTRFAWAFEELNARLTLAGYVVLSCGCFGHTIGVEHSEQEKAQLDALHLHKISISDEVYVLDVDGYTGESTKREINYAEQNQKKIRYLSNELPGLSVKDCLYSLSARRSS